MKATKSTYSPVVLFGVLYRLILTSEDRRGNPIMGFNPLLKPSMQ